MIFFGRKQCIIFSSKIILFKSALHLTDCLCRLYSDLIIYVENGDSKFCVSPTIYIKFSNNKIFSISLQFVKTSGIYVEYSGILTRRQFQLFRLEDIFTTALLLFPAKPKNNIGRGNLNTLGWRLGQKTKVQHQDGN